MQEATPKKRLDMQEAMPKKGLRCAIYIRVSTAEQAMHGKSLNAQTEYLTSYAREHHMEIMGIFADEGKTARKNFKDRKAIKRLLGHVKRDEVDIILFWKMDRWFRNVSDFYKVQDILDAHHTKWIAAAEPNMSLDTREGRLNLNIMLSINQNETDTTSERIRFVNEVSVRQGKVITGSQPFGYKVQVVDGMKKIVKDAKTEGIVHEFYRHYLTHHSKRGAFLHLTEVYGPVITMRQVDSLCNNPMYSGCYRNNPGYCPPYLSLEQWESLQRIKEHNIKKYSSQVQAKEVYLFPGIIPCPVCGRYLSCNRIMKNSHTKRNLPSVYRYYRCQNWIYKKTCTYSKQVNETNVEQYLLDGISSSPARYQVQVNAISLNGKNHDGQEKAAGNQDKIRRELQRLNWLYQKGRISRQSYELEFGMLESQLEEQPYEDGRMGNCGGMGQTDNPDITCQTVMDTVNGGWEYMYNKLSRENKQAFWRCLIKEIQLEEANSLVKAVVFL